MGVVSAVSRAAQIVYAIAVRFPRQAGTILRQAITADPADYYTFVGTDLVNFRGAHLDATRSLWLNVGDWREARTYEEACTALARRLGEAAAIGPGDEVLDAGFGFGDQDFFWLQTAKPKRIVGINITPIHVAVAQRRARALGVTGQAEFILASATEIPAADASFDKVVSLEAACHFRTREQFLADAFRVLKPGGMLALTDVIPLPDGHVNGVVARIERRFNAFPEENLYDRHTYVDRLRAAGFAEPVVTSIRNDVYPGMAKFIAAKKLGGTAETIRIELSAEEMERCAGDEIWTRQGIGDYVLVTARKPLI